MKVNILSTTLNKILRKAAGIVSSGNINPIYDGILIKADKDTNTLNFVTLNDSVKFNYVQTEDLTVYESGTVFVKYKNLDAIISKMPSDEITLEKVDTNSLRITKTNFELNINIMDEKIFIDIDFNVDENWKQFKLNSNLFSLVEKKLFHCCLSKLEKVSHLNGVYFDTTTTEGKIFCSSTDSYKVAMLNKDYSGLQFKLIFEQDLIKFINANISPDREINFYITNTNLYLKWDNITLISKINNTMYPNIYNAFNLPSGFTKFNINSADLQRVVERGIFIVTGSKNPVVLIKSIKPQIEVSYKSTDIGSSFENLTADKFEGEDFSTILNSKFFISILKAFEGHSIEVNYLDPNKQIVLIDNDDKDYKQLILPLRVN
ncbi:MAG: DNA polymerase III subunit beta [Mycoplasma sp.]